MSIIRYHVSYGNEYIDQSDDGEYVSYEDYSALEQKLAESQREFRAADATIENLQMQFEKLAALRIALASLEAEPVGYIDAEYSELLKSGHIESCSVYAEAGEGCTAVFSAPLAPASIPDEDLLHMAASAIEDLLSNKDRSGAGVWADVPAKLRRAAMLQGADTELQRKAAINDVLCEKYGVESLADFVDWQRNHIAELEAAPPAPVGEGETAVMPDYPGYVMTQRECYQAGKKAGLAEAGGAPVANDGWVACGERMPEDTQMVLAFSYGEIIAAYWNYVMCPIEYKKYRAFTYLSGSRLDGVTHWMPLPAAPQQEVK